MSARRVVGCTLPARREGLCEPHALTWLLSRDSEYTPGRERRLATYVARRSVRVQPQPAEAAAWRALEDALELTHTEPDARARTSAEQRVLSCFLHVRQMVRAARECYRSQIANLLSETHSLRGELETLRRTHSAACQRIDELSAAERKASERADAWESAAQVSKEGGR